MSTEVGSRVPSQHTRKFLRFVEEHAAILRQRTGAGPTDKLDPQRLVRELKLVIAWPDNIAALAPEDRAYLSNVDPRTWSGMGGVLPDGRLLVLLHPGQTPERATVTTMEEVAHQYYHHQPTKLSIHPAGLQRREYDVQAEAEAYWTAAAVLLPSRAVAMAVWQGVSAQELALQYGVSVELVEFRIKVHRLWRDYRAQTERKVG